MTPQNKSGGGAANTNPPGTYQNALLNCRSTGDADKVLTGMQARAARVGMQLLETESGYLLCGRDMAEHAPCLRCVGILLRRIGVLQ